MRSELAKAHSRLSELKQRRLDLETQLADTDLFVAELEERIANIDESSTAAAHLGAAVFPFCPSCFATIDKSEIPGVCHLCKSPFSEDTAKSQLVRMRNELALQQRESKVIRDKQTAELGSINREIPALEGQVSTLEIEYKRNSVAWRSPNEIAAHNVAREMGAKEQEIRNTLELKKLALLLDEHNRKLVNYEAELTWVRSRILAVTKEQENKREVAYLSIAEHVRRLLREDLERQIEFIHAEAIGIDFAANRVTVNGQAQFSASSMVYLKHSFHLALLLASAERSFFRYPRLTILDGIEDGGMEPERSFNFQELIRKRSELREAEHQIILATSHINPALNTSKYVVGDTLSHEHKALAIDT